VGSAAALEEGARDGDIAGYIPFPGQNLTDGPREQFRYAIADVRAGDEQHPIAQAAQREEAGFESQDFGEVNGRAGMQTIWNRAMRANGHTTLSP
jgi:hypothetical protein